MKLNHHLHVLCNRSKEGSYQTQSNRRDTLQLCAKELKNIGYRQINSLHSLKPKHISALVQQWQKNDLSAGTIKNRMSALRWVAEKIARPDLVAKNNAFYGIENRVLVGPDKSLEFTDRQINSICDIHVKTSAMLQRDFGLRREEAMKICVAKADQGDHLKLKGSWCKGGRERDISITNDTQRTTLDFARKVAGNSSLIPQSLSYRQQINVFEREMRSVGLGRTHGARHAYAQRRYEQLTGWKSPAQGGPRYSKMNQEDQQIDRVARQQISRELGHERLEITGVYLNGQGGQG